MAVGGGLRGWHGKVSDGTDVRLVHVNARGTYGLWTVCMREGEREGGRERGLSF